jgi:hypothetical protein
VKVELIREAKYSCEDFERVRDVLNEIHGQCEIIEYFDEIEPSFRL